MNRVTSSLTVLGAALAVVGVSALWLVATGYRLDAEGTSPSAVEMLLGWGGLGVGVVVAAGAGLVLARSGRVPSRRRRRRTSNP